MRLFLAVLVGKAIRIIAKLRGGGSAIPGRIAMIIEPKLLQKTLGSLKHGVIFVSGSNGKSTTTALIAGTLSSQGMKVFSNPSGGNMPQGIGSAVISQASLTGKLDAAVAVLEVDEAYGEVLAPFITPSYVVLTNIQIDQLNRFFEPDRVYQMLRSAATSATGGVVINGSDANLVDIGLELQGQNASQVSVSEKALSKWPAGALAAPRFGKANVKNSLPVSVKVLDEVDGLATLELLGKTVTVRLPGKGLHFAIDTALAFAVAEKILGESFEVDKASEAISTQETVYGRGEIVSYQGEEIQILMMKNPSSMRATLVSMEDPETEIWIAMDEGTPDPSWLFDIDLTRIGQVRMVSGSRAWHVATRLAYAGIHVEEVLPDSRQALAKYGSFLKEKGRRGTLLTNYEQMMAIRKLMGFLDLESGK
ncbi:MAG: MurT ligase domain-containing protein [Rhodoluna sp.]